MVGALTLGAIFRAEFLTTAVPGCITSVATTTLAGVTTLAATTTSVAAAPLAATVILAVTVTSPTPHESLMAVGASSVGEPMATVAECKTSAVVAGRLVAVNVHLAAIGPSREALLAAAGRLAAAVDVPSAEAVVAAHLVAAEAGALAAEEGDNSETCS